MSDLGQRLADELRSVADHLGTPYVDAAGLAAAGRRESARRRVATGLLAGAAAVVLAGGLLTVLPRDGARDTVPAGPLGTDRALDRPLELPWWSPEDQILHVAGAEIPVDATAIVQVGGRSLVAQQVGGETTWETVDGGSRRRVGGTGEILGAPVAGPDGRLAWVERSSAPGTTAPAVWRQEDDGSGTGQTRPDWRGRTIEVVASQARRASLVTVDGELWAWDFDEPRPTRVTGAPGDLALGSVAPRPGGVAALVDGRVVAAQVDPDGRFHVEWETDGDGSGAWSADGEQYAEVADRRLDVATRAGTVGMPLEHDDLRVIGWESDSEVVVAQWVEEDRAVTGVWRCSAVELRCAEVADAPNGRVLLPGL